MVNNNITPEAADKILSSESDEDNGILTANITPGFHAGSSHVDGLQLAIDSVLELPVEVRQDDNSVGLIPDRIPLNAYLACALTGLDDTKHELMVWLSNSVRSVCEAEGVDLYEPRNHTDPSNNDSYTPEEVFYLDREKVLSSDLLIALTNEPSFGAGQELDFAFNANIPIILLVRTGNKISRMVTGIPGLVAIVEYDEPETLRDQLTKELVGLRPLLQERRIRRSNYSLNVVGDRIRRARESAGLTVEEVASSLGIEASQISRWEQSSDADNNFSLIQLRDIATILNVSLAQLVESSMDNVCLAYFRDILDDQNVAARWGSHSSKDRKRLLAVLINRLAIELGVDEPFSI